MPSRRSALPSRDVSLIVTAVGLSALGDFLAYIPLAVHLQERTHSGIVLALLPFSLWAPIVVLAGPAGLLVDRLETRRLLLVVSLLQAGVATGLAFVESTAPILLLAALIGTGYAVAQPAEFALVPELAPPERLREVNGYVETARYVGMIAGPLLGGLLASAGGTRVALLVNAASFAVVALAALLLHARRHPAPRAHGEPRERARDGLVFLLREPTLAVVMTVAFVSLLFMSAQIPAEPFFVMDYLDAGAIGFGALYTAWIAGMALGSLAVARRVAPTMIAVGALAATAVQGFGLALPTLWLTFGFAAVWFAIGGVGHGTKNVLVRTLMHERVPDRLRGRAFAAYNGIRNGAELVALLVGGLLVAAIGARLLLFLAGALSAATALAALLLARRRLLAETPVAATRTA
jgi:MFS family permease